MSLGLILAFLGVCLIAYVTPGPDWFIIMRFTTLSRSRGFISAFGVQTGLALHVFAASLGVTAAVLAGPTAFTILKFAGAAYLVFLGIQILIKEHRNKSKNHGEELGSPKEAARRLDVFWKSFLANALNPQAAIFFTAVLPQFINPNNSLLPQVVILGALDIGLGLMWWAAYIYGIILIRRLLGARRSQHVLNTIAGLALIIFGTALAFINP